MTFVEIMMKAGVSRGKSRIVEKESAGRSTHERGFHALRHAFVTMLTNYDVDEDLRKSSLVTRIPKFTLSTLTSK